jgi:hypothetical protein
MYVVINVLLVVQPRKQGNGQSANGTGGTMKMLMLILGISLLLLAGYCLWCAGKKEKPEPQYMKLSGEGVTRTIIKFKSLNGKPLVLYNSSEICIKNIQITGSGPHSVHLEYRDEELENTEKESANKETP